MFSRKKRQDHGARNPRRGDMGSFDRHMGPEMGAGMGNPTEAFMDDYSPDAGNPKDREERYVHQDYFKAFADCCDDDVV
uniref:Uncharacterized protein n=1 Tax=Chromera velia CCMP2878 TaxID=1169474 RepID=A0A0G4HGP0_9ALVE|eukprot:Cvel_6771.t1-p1 / transcript=Cvel_6771.t1 / gene=Cvel_6771 / organism=Chromera_velia_CCMP2878 / gene_product=hypothetical protein / transcript_product=hypothetical protein / location=Cvel_scaffold340:10784-11199(-) / protein_length=78 / sequence_SO=supercontig / SO=protein_coding / is_pseudo=false